MRITFVFMVSAAIGCGGPAEGPKAPTGGGGSGDVKPAAPGDVSFDVVAQEIKGLVFEPEAMGSPGMPLAEPKGQREPQTGAKLDALIKKQQQTFTNTKDPVQKEAQATLLATMLYHKSKELQGDDQQQRLKDARQVLRDAAQVSGAKVDDITLRILGSYELLLGDYPAAEKAWSMLVTNYPKDKDELFNRAWWAFSLLKQFKNAEALAVVKDQKLDDKQPELAYTTAWAKWRTGDDAGAWQAILTAARGWKDVKGSLRDALDRDVYLFAGRTNTSMTDAVTQLSSVYGKAKDQQYDLLAALGLKAYRFAGRWNDGVAAIEKALAVAGDKVPTTDRPVLFYEEADYTVSLDDPVAAEKFAKQALESLPGCGQKCSDKDKETIVESISGMATLFHVLYATANDVRYYQPAHDLYEATIPLLTMNDARRAESTKYAATLEATLRGMKAGTGTHEKGAMTSLLGHHNQEVQACYELGLQSNPKLGGTVIVNLEVEQSGVVKGASTDPKAGLADLSLVAGCVAEHAKAWKLPKRGQAGTTRIKLTYNMSPPSSAPRK
ncbi:MAG: hypothetical protein JWO36_7532 [Myxococcales bacterium]|nr:hypothetical protein [Myxococcales bacterium]